MQIAFLLFYVVFTVLTLYGVQGIAQKRPWYKYHITAFGLPMWAMCTLIAVWFACSPSGQHSRWLCFGWFAFYLLPICLWLACLFAKIFAFVTRGNAA